MKSQALGLQEVNQEIRKQDSMLAVDGGDPVVSGGYIMHSRWPRIDDDEIESVIRVLRSGLLTEMSGRSIVQQFESEVAMWLGASYALTTNSGTAALHCALAGLGIQSGDEVIVPALTYIACAAAVLHHQAIPIFADVDPYTYNISPESVEASITSRTKAIMAVHLHGLPADMDALLEIGERHGIPILEDFSQAAGASYKGKMVGSLGAVGAASLMAGKNLPSAGEGGILVTKDRAIRNRAATLKCFGEAVEADGSYATLHETVGLNYRINILSAAFASQQLFHVDKFNDTRIAMAGRLDDTLNEIPGFIPPVVPPGVRHVYHMYRFRFEPRLAGMSVTADQAHEALKQVFWSEGLPLIEFQNVPLPGHALLQQKVGYGRGCPWSCHQRSDVVYDIENYPGALDAIRHSLVIGYPAQAPMANEDVVDHYIQCFKKVSMNLRAFERFASSMPSAPPYEQPARLF
jgi:dTDP-4-amino-4,6-dideoxygalactose transaminase